MNEKNRRWTWSRFAVLLAATLGVVLLLAVGRSPAGTLLGGGGGGGQAASPSESSARPEHLYRIRPAETRISFEVAKFGVFKVEGQFRKAEGKIVYDPAHPEASQVGVRVKVASLDTNEPGRDDTVRSEDFLFAERFPEMSFVSRQVTPAGEGVLKVRGQLTIRGVTKEVEVPVKVLGLSPDHGRTLAGFEAELIIDRRDFNVLGARWSAGRALIGNEIRIHLLVGAESVAG